MHFACVQTLISSHSLGHFPPHFALIVYLLSLLFTHTNISDILCLDQSLYIALFLNFLETQAFWRAVFHLFSLFFLSVILACPATYTALCFYKFFLQSNMTFVSLTVTVTIIYKAYFITYYIYLIIYI